MNDRNIQNIKSYLQTEEVQKRISENMLRRRSEVTVTIGRAAELFGFTENQLRDWEDRGLLTPQRSTKQRQYTLADLDKLTIIRELIDAKYAPGDIPANVDGIWNEFYTSIEHVQLLKSEVNRSNHLHIDQRIERTDEEVFWRYFVSQTLRLSIMLICEDIPETIAGLVLPLQMKKAFIVHDPNDLHKIGNSLIGWLGRNRSFYTFLDNSPSFEFPSDFRVHPLVMSERDIPQENTLIVVQRKSRALSLSGSLVKTIRRLLEPIYQNVEKWLPCFDYGMRDWLYQVTDFTSSPNLTDDVLSGLTNMIVRLGGKTDNNQDRWRFSCILLPKDSSLPLQQQSLVVRAQSDNAPYNVGVVSVSPGKKVDSFGINVFQNSLSLKAHQSGHIIYRPGILAGDSLIAYREKEGAIRSAIAVPIGGEDELSAGVIYVVSDETNAFSDDDQRILRVISRMVGELLLTYRARQLGMDRLADMITNPEAVDTSFKEFLSENEFLSDVETLLTDIQKRSEKGQLQEDMVAFVAIDIDNQSSLASKYGNHITRNLSKEVGLRILGQREAFFTNLQYRRLYHVYADRFYFILKGTSLEGARTRAEHLRQVLQGDYRISSQPFPTSVGRPNLPENMLELSEVTVRLAVTWYPYGKLEEILKRYDSSTAVGSVMALINRSLDEVLDQGQREGGNVVISWDPQIWGYVRWSPA
jgi:DNA-binding transcriptional MerR regulator/GGDEF domain-containing protein